MTLVGRIWMVVRRLDDGWDLILTQKTVTGFIGRKGSLYLLNGALDSLAILTMKRLFESYRSRGRLILTSHILSPPPNNNSIEVVVETPADPDPVEGRGKCIRKESEYVRMLKDGSAITGQGSKNILPKGMQLASTITAVNENVEAEHAMATIIESAEGSMPTHEEALKSPDWPKWEDAINKGLDNLKRFGTWEMVKRPPNANVVDSKWVLRIKKNSAGEVKKYKARVVAKGFTQIYGIDYYETYAPVARLASFRILLALAARNDWAIHSFIRKNLNCIFCIILQQYCIILQK